MSENGEGKVVAAGREVWGFGSSGVCPILIPIPTPIPVCRDGCDLPWRRAAMMPDRTRTGIGH